MLFRRKDDSAVISWLSSVVSWKLATRKGKIAGVTTAVMMEEAMEEGAVAMTIIPMEKPYLCKLVRVKAIKSNDAQQ